MNPPGCLTGRAAYSPMTPAAPHTARERCGARNRSGGTCGLPAGHGTDHVGAGRCRLHGGRSPSGRKAAQRQQALHAAATYGLARDVDPVTALLEELHRTAGHVAWLGTLIANLGTGDDLKQRAPGAGGALIEAPSVWVELYHRERAHLTRVAKTCVDVGIEERRVRLAERQGLLLAEAIRGILGDLGVADRPETPEVVRRHLMLVAGDG